MSEIFIIEDNNSGERIEKVISQLNGEVNRTYAATLIEKGFVKINGKPVNKSYKVKSGDWLELIIPPAESAGILPAEIKLDIRYEDEDVAVVNKPKGMVVHPAAGNRENTLVNALLFHFKDSLSGINGVLRPGIVHRIDKDTSGLLIVAKNDRAHNCIAEQLSAHTAGRTYHAVVCGVIREDSGKIDAPVGRSEKDRKKMAVTDKNSKPAVTKFEVIKRFDEFTYIKAVLETGRTHQIRVHMAHIGHPVAGDSVYGAKKAADRLPVLKGIHGQCLHAKEIEFNLPRNGERIKIETDLPEYFTDFLNKLEVLD